MSKFVPIATITNLENTKVYWNPAEHAFVLDDCIIPRTESNLRVFAQMISFNPAEYGCSRCGCSTELRKGQQVCWCDTCKHGCGKINKLEPLPLHTIRKPSPFFNKPITMPTKPLSDPLERLMTLG
jgi:hypothetical protein